MMNASAPQPSDTEMLAERDTRRSVTLPGFALLQDGSTFGITLLNLSYDGCRIESPVALLKGLTLKLSVLRLGALNAHVRWYANGRAGLQFGAETPPIQHKKRDAERFDLPTEVALRRPGRSLYHTRLFDLSNEGCRVEFVERPRIGERIWVKLAGLDSIEAEVRWREDFFGGLKFVRPIYPAVFELLSMRLRAG
jgi:hypothetical protein